MIDLGKKEDELWEDITSNCKQAIKKAQRGDVVTISEIKVKFVGINQPSKNVSPCTFEIQ